MLECSSSTTAATTRRPAARPFCAIGAGSGDHRRDAALHVLRAAAVQAAVALGRHERIVHAGDAHRVGVAAEHQRASLRAPIEHADDIRAAGRHRFDGHLEADATHRGGDGGGNFLLAGRAGNERRVDGVDGDEIAKQADRWIHRRLACHEITKPRKPKLSFVYTSDFVFSCFRGLRICSSDESRHRDHRRIRGHRARDGVRLARDGAAVAICARRADRLDAVAAEITAAGGQALADSADVTDADGMERLRQPRCRALRPARRDDVQRRLRHRRRHRRGHGGADAEADGRQLHRHLPRRPGRARRVSAAASGHIIIVSSIVGKRGVPYMGAYAATKFAQVGLAECLRSELVGTAIHVSVVYPVSTDTEFFDVMSHETGTTVVRGPGPRQDVETVADAIARAIERPVPEVYPLFKSRALVWLNAFAPGFCDRVVQRFGRKPLQRERR